MASPLENLEAPEPDGSAAGVWPRTARRVDGVLEIGGVTASELASTFGTPLYVVDEAEARLRARAWTNAARRAFDDFPGVHVYYAGKAFLSVAVARWMAEEGLGVDTCSEGELRTALAAGVAPSLIGLHGNNKSREEIELALTSGIAHLVVDSLSELAVVDQEARRLGVVAPILLRVTTGIHAGGHEYISTATEDQKFGLSIASGAAMRAIEEAAAAPHIELRGLHSHIGSQIFGISGFEASARIVLALRSRAMRELGIDLPEVDFGGGFGIRYTVLDDVPPEPGEYLEALASVISEECSAAGVSRPEVFFEPGRSIIGPAGVTLYTVGTIKALDVEDGNRRYVSVDGGMSDNIRPALYGADYTAALASRAPEGSVRSRVVGKHCESGDIVVRDVALSANLTRGDLLAVPATGAYGRSMASNYNHAPRPGVVAVGEGEARWIVRPERVEDVLALDADFLEESAGS